MFPVDGKYLSVRGLTKYIVLQHLWCFCIAYTAVNASHQVIHVNAFFALLALCNVMEKCAIRAFSPLVR